MAGTSTLQPWPAGDKDRQNRINWGGEARFRIMDEDGDAPAGWAGERVSLESKPNTDGVFGIKADGGVKAISDQKRDDDGVSLYTVTGAAERVFGWSRYETELWPYLELNLSF